jgi:SAM-dependent methyltransferase
MAYEATKTRAIWDKDTLKYFEGSGIDIGCGLDPIFPHVRPFDQQHGDANKITEFVSERYDFVFSSHCLEHMHDPKAALVEWFKLVKPGGHMITLVPDEDLYEQGVWPSYFNDDHKHTFTISKKQSWSPKSINVLDLVKLLNAELVSVELHDHGLDRTLLHHGASKLAYHLGRRGRRWSLRLPFAKKCILRIFRAFGAIVDQTDLADHRLAQIQFIVRKPL